MYNYTSYDKGFSNFCLLHLKWETPEHPTWPFCEGNALFRRMQVFCAFRHVLCRSCLFRQRHVQVHVHVKYQTPTCGEIGHLAKQNDYTGVDFCISC